MQTGNNCKNNPDDSEDASERTETPPTVAATVSNTPASAPTSVAIVLTGDDLDALDHSPGSIEAVKPRIVGGRLYIDPVR